MLKKLGRKLEKEITKPFRKRRKHELPPPPPLPLPPPPPPPPPPKEPSTPQLEPQQQKPRQTFPFLFPTSHSTILPDPSKFFSPSLLSSPLPTNSFFQNFTLNNGDRPEYVHPYLIKSSHSSLSISYPSMIHTSSFVQQAFQPDLTISASDKSDPNTLKNHVISSYSDLSVTLDMPSSNLRFYLVRGSPYLTCSALINTSIVISTMHPILSFSSNSSLTKHTLKLDNGQTWLIYTSSQMNLSRVESSITSNGYSGIIRIAILPDSSNRKNEGVLDRFSPCYAVSGDADVTKPFSIEYKWERSGYGDLLMLAHPLHIKLLSSENVIVLNDFKYKSIDGDLVGVLGDSWLLKSDPISITWHSTQGVKNEHFGEIVSSLSKNVESLNQSSAITIDSPYHCAKIGARAARLSLIAEEIGHKDVIPAITKYLKEIIEPWLDGTLTENGFLYDEKWGGIVTKKGSLDLSADFGFGIYNNHHSHLGYFLYAIAVVAKIDPLWGNKYKPQAYSLMADFMNMGRRENSSHARLRCFDLYKLHSWSTGLTESTDGRNQESSSDAVNAYYSAALMGLAYGDSYLVAVGSTLAAMETEAARTWVHVKEGERGLYGEEFGKENRLVSVLWANKRESNGEFVRQFSPLLPISEVLFCDSGFAKEVVSWVMGRGVSEEWKGFVYAIEGIYDRENAVEKIKNLSEVEEGNSLTNLLWWVHSRGNQEQKALCKGAGNLCWFAHYCL